MRRELLEHEDREKQTPTLRKKHPRHPITLENTPEETIRIMEGFPERAAKLRELIRGLREADTR
jgi:hypothetical protein